ncbi:MAG TPA: beta-ketoacyl-ACP synthase II [Candidatus Limnocylindrales bacterium]|nr:beta-ketoacyl-ACP synthase II [Candidatus Limnocylindrales bacterium]
MTGNRRVVITGYGAVTPLGLTAEESWEGIRAGRSGVGPITRFDASNFAVRIAAEVKHFRPEDYLSPKEVRRRSHYQHFIAAAAQEVLRHSGFTVTDANRERTSVLIGSSMGGVANWDEEIQAASRDGLMDFRRLTPMAIPMMMSNGGSDYVGLEIGARGPGAILASACATGADNIGFAFELIRQGRIDQALAGGCDAVIFPIGIAAFDRTGALSRENEHPERACRPFSLNRPGLVFSEGAAVLALEELEGAKARGANILGEIVGYAQTSDAFHITAPDPMGAGAAAAITLALQSAGLTGADIDYINAHGTGTGLNDVMETQATKLALGERAYQIPMSSTKSMTGHAMAGTAAMEAIFCLQAMRDSIVPPTINLDEPDPACDLDYVPNTARELPLRTVMSNSFGFGGHNASLIFKAFAG